MFSRLVIRMSQNTELEFQKVLLAENVGSLEWKNGCISRSLVLLSILPCGKSFTTVSGVGFVTPV